MTVSNDHTYNEFIALVNIPADELEKWLQTDESKSVGVVKGTISQKITNPETQESVGHESGRIIVELLRMNQQDYDEAAYKHMRKVNGYIKRHLTQGPTKQRVETSRWRYSLMNWGHDPLK